MLLYFMVTLVTYCICHNTIPKWSSIIRVKLFYIIAEKNHAQELLYPLSPIFLMYNFVFHCMVFGSEIDLMFRDSKSIVANVTVARAAFQPRTIHVCCLFLLLPLLTVLTICWMCFFFIVLHKTRYMISRIE